MTLKVNIKNKADFYVNIFGIMQVINPEQFTLTTTEKRLISGLYSKRDELINKGSTDDEANMVVFSPETREILMNELGISYNSYNNIISALRKNTGLIVNRKLHPFFAAMQSHDIDDEFLFTLKFINE